MNNTSMMWVQVPQGRVLDGQAGKKQHQRRASIVTFVMDIMGVNVESATRMIRKQREVFTEAASRALVVSNQRLGVEATLQVMKACHSSWTSMRALKRVLVHYGIHLKVASEAAVKEHVQEFSVEMAYFRAYLNGAKGIKVEALV
ncbi:MAG: hypothetical protein R6V31_09105, partial [Halohasta sp.]